MFPLGIIRVFILGTRAAETHGTLNIVPTQSLNGKMLLWQKGIQPLFDWLRCLTGRRKIPNYYCSSSAWFTYIPKCLIDKVAAIDINVSLFNLSISFLLISLPLSSPLRVMYSGLELQWILPSLYYITGKSFIFTLRPYYHFGAGIGACGIGQIKISSF
jgi:hypothetical protein